MKRFLPILSWIVALAFVTTLAPALAESDLMRFQPYTDVDLNVFEKAAYSCTYDEWGFTAEISPAANSIEYNYNDPDYSSISDNCTVSVDIKVVYGAGTATLVPRLIFQRKGTEAYFDSRMDKVYIKVGENRYRADLTGVSRSTDSKNYSATESVVEPLTQTGILVLRDIATSTEKVSVCLNGVDVYRLTDTDKGLLSDFYTNCEKAGIFEQSSLSALPDHYHIVTLFNENSEGIEEDVSMAEEVEGEEAEDNAD